MLIFDSYPFLSESVFAFSSLSEGGRQVNVYTEVMHLFLSVEKKQQTIHTYKPKNNNEFFASPQNFVTALFLAHWGQSQFKNLNLYFQWGIKNLRWETQKNENVCCTLIKRNQIRKENQGHSPPPPPPLSSPSSTSPKVFLIPSIRRVHMFQSTKQTPNIVLCGIFRYSCHTI